MNGDETTGRDKPGPTAANAATLPTATLRPERRYSVAWVVPVVALLLAAWLATSAWRQRGLLVVVHLPDGHGLKVGDPVRYRGISVGEVRSVELAGDLGAVEVGVSLRAEANAIARSGTRFWVVRPQLRVSGVEGLETLLGPRYLAAMPALADGGAASAQREFVGLAAPPPVATVEPDDLEIIVEAKTRGGLQVGAPVRYRQMRIGTVLSVGLGSDASIVEARVHVRKAYRQLIRRRTRFWDAAGLRTKLGISGLSLEMDSLETLLAGGIALATPPPGEAGGTVHTGHRFRLHDAPEDAWLEWEPSVAVGSSLLPPGSRLPQPQRATLAWKQGFLIKGRRTRGGWVLPTADGLLGPADLLTPLPADGDADRATVSLEVAGQVVPLRDEPARVAEGLARLDVELDAAEAWPDDLLRAATTPEDCIAVADPSAPPLPLAASRLVADGVTWAVDPAVPLDESWHGACVLSRADGRLVGILLVEDDRTRVALLADGGEAGGE